MALFTIAEPGQSKHRTKPGRKRAVGIDLGTTNSLVAVAREGEASTLAGDDGNYLLPSIVHYFPENTLKVGAPTQSDANVSNTQTLVSPVSISSVKRLMGRGSSDISYQLPYQLQESPDGGMPRIITPSGPVSPVQVSAEILKILAARGSEALGGELDGVVITVPAYFDEAQRQATRDAATLAGLNVLRLLSEPTAAAVAYGLDKKLQGTVIIYDLGGGTFDVSLMKLEKGVFEVLATGGNAALGGDDFDRAIANWVLKEATVTSALSTPDYQQLMSLARELKHNLTESVSTEVQFRNWSGILTRETYYGLVDGLIDETIRACRRVLRDAKVDASDISEVVMVGGATRSPRVREKVSTFFQKDLLTSIDPDQVVALGAALQADVLVGNKYGDDMLLLDVIPLSLGIETMGGLMEKIIPRNSTIPTARAQEFTTYKDGQTAMLLHVLQGERELISDCRSLARFELKGIPPMVAGAARIRVTFQVDADGLLEVKAQELATGVNTTVVIKPSFGLQEQDIATMLTDSYASAAADKELRNLREKQVEALRHIEALEAALQQDGETLLIAEERHELEQSIISLREAISGEDARKIDQLTQSLNSLSGDFATRRMDLQIKNALQGHTLAELDKFTQQGTSK
ncbi:MAG: Fe-S protein assembly chaperone HscA [Pseudomonadota bacterium]